MYLFNYKIFHQEDSVETIKLVIIMLRFKMSSLVNRINVNWETFVTIFKTLSSIYNGIRTLIAHEGTSIAITSNKTN